MVLEFCCGWWLSYVDRRRRRAGRLAKDGGRRGGRMEASRSSPYSPLSAAEAGLSSSIGPSVVALPHFATLPHSFGFLIVLFCPLEVEAELCCPLLSLRDALSIH